MSADYSDAVATRALLCEVLIGKLEPRPEADSAAALLDVARAERVLSLVAWRIAASEGLDTWFGSAARVVREEVQRQAVCEEIHVRELRHVFARLSEVPGAMPLVFKGAALAYSHYPEPWLRPRLDTDILISPDRASRSLNALQAAGYRAETATSGTVVSAQASLDRTDRFGVTHVLDVHWQIANRSIIARVLSHAELASRAVPIPALGPHARAVSNVDALVIACLHRAAHHRDSEDLLWLYDIHLIASGLSRAEWDLMMAIAERGQVRALCARGLALATDRFATTVPADVVTRLASSATEPSAVYLSKDVRLVDWLLADLRGLPWRQRGRLLAEHVLPPAAYIRDRYGVRSRRGLMFAYMARVLTGVPKWFARGARR